MLVNEQNAAHFEIDPARLDLVAEFRRSPHGPHSDALQKVLHRMRWGGVVGRFVLITLEPGRRWMLGRLPDQRGTPIETFPNRIFTAIEAAEWEIFRLRWEALTGNVIPE
jgi:hypothetical protein